MLLLLLLLMLLLLLALPLLQATVCQSALAAFCESESPMQTIETQVNRLSAACTRVCRSLEVGASVWDLFSPASPAMLQPPAVPQ